jgi:spermidine synthase
MTTESEFQQDTSSSRGYIPVLLLLFVGSGCAALIYEIVWFQLLQLAIGSTAVSLGVLLGTFMGGMCLGSLALPYLISPKWHPLRVYALLELGIGLIGVAMLFVLPVAGGFYAEHVGHGHWAIAFRGLICAICLLPPTVLMGATLPAIARWMETSPLGVSRLGLFYGANIAGAVFGCLLAGFLLLRVYDVAVATYVAVAINGTVSLTGLVLALVATYRPPVPAEALRQAVSGPRPWSVYVAIALSGLSAMGAEVVWTRLLSLLLGGTVYTFALILAVFLVGLGIGSTVGSMLARGQTSPRLMLGWCQLLLVAAIGWAAFMIGSSLPHWPINPLLIWDDWGPWYTFQLDLVRCFWVMLPAACLWGASFPLALAGAATPGQDPGRLVGRVYAANTVGAIIGSLLFSIVMIAWVGTQRSQQALIAVAALAALLMIGPALWGALPSTRGATRQVAADGLLGWVGLVLVVGLAGLGVWSVPKLNPWVVAYGRTVATEKADEDTKMECWEGMNSSIAVSKDPNGLVCFHVSGKVCASNDPADMRMQRMLGHLPGLICPTPRKVLVVGCGAGVTAGSFIPYPDVEKIVICEIEPVVPRAAAENFGEENYFVVNAARGAKGDPRVEIIYDDARHFINTTKEKFDVITSDPVDPWIKGAATLYTTEYLETCKQHLNDGGTVAQWAPLYETSGQAVRSQIKTFMNAFPDGSGTLWSNDIYGSGYDYVLVGQVGRNTLDVDALQERLNRDDYAAVRESLAQVEFPTLIGLLATYGGRGPDLEPWLREAEVNRDRTLRLQYLAGLGVNLHVEDLIFHEIMFYRHYPDSYFHASEPIRQALRLTMGFPADEGADEGADDSGNESADDVADDSGNESAAEGSGEP